MTIDPGSSGSSSVFAAVALLPGRPSLGLLWGTRIVLFLVCPFVSFSLPRDRGCGEPKRWMGLGIIPSDFSTRLSSDFFPYGGNDRLDMGGCGCVYVCLLLTRTEGRSVNCSILSLNWS